MGYPGPDSRVKPIKQRDTNLQTFYCISTVLHSNLLCSSITFTSFFSNICRITGYKNKHFNCFDSAYHVSESRGLRTLIGSYSRLLLPEKSTKMCQSLKPDICCQTAATFPGLPASLPGPAQVQQFCHLWYTEGQDLTTHPPSPFPFPRLWSLAA